MPRWRIYYGDGQTFDSDDGTPAEAPPHNVQCIIEPNDLTGRGITHRWDFYLWDDAEQEWFGVDLFGLLDHLMARGILKAGRTIPTRIYEAVLTLAEQDPDFPRRSAYREGERRAPAIGTGRGNR